jgi:hypothetical protein
MYVTGGNALQSPAFIAVLPVADLTHEASKRMPCGSRLLLLQLQPQLLPRLRNPSGIVCQDGGQRHADCSFSQSNSMMLKKVAILINVLYATYNTTCRSL